MKNLLKSVLLVVYQVAAGIDGLLSQLDNKLVTILVEGFLFSFTISPRSLAGAGREIYNYLENDDLEEYANPALKAKLPAQREAP